jgi:hypothetical protein
MGQYAMKEHMSVTLGGPIIIVGQEKATISVFSTKRHTWYILCVSHEAWSPSSLSYEIDFKYSSPLKQLQTLKSHIP